MRAFALLTAYAALLGAFGSWVAAVFYYWKTHAALSIEQTHLRAQLFFNWLFVSGRLTGEARESARKVHISLAVFVACLIIAGGAFIVAVAPL